MNAKYAVALILALQVSMSLCESPTPSQELVDKYDSLKTTFKSRVLNLLGKLQGAVNSAIGDNADSGTVTQVKTAIENMQTNPQYQSFMQIVSGLIAEASPLVAEARKAMLAKYEQEFRADYGESVDQVIKSIQVYLNQLMPAE